MKRVIHKLSVVVVILFNSLFPSNGFSQTDKNNPIYSKHAESMPEDNILLKTIQYDGETLPLITLNEIQIGAQRVFKNAKAQQEYYRLWRDVHQAYPYAVLASIKLKEYDAILANVPEKERTPYLKQTEKELKTQFESDLKNLTMNQGRILIRLINRETGMTTYKVIKDYRGTFSAFIWQSFAILWGNNLKWKYDPTEGEDKLIEDIIQQIQDGEV
jgi:hypothetical protein